MRARRLLTGGLLAAVFAASAASVADAEEPLEEPEQPTYSLRLRAVADDERATPLPAAEVVIRSDGDEHAPGFVRRGRVDADGRLVLPALPCRDFDIVVRSPGRVRAAHDIQVEGGCVVYGRLLPIREGASEELELRLPEAATHRGRVLDAVSREPVAGLRVCAVPQTYVVPRPTHLRYGAAVTEADGSFELPDVPRDAAFHVVVHGPGWTFATADVPAAHRAPTEVAVSRAGAVGGRVLDPTGAAAAGVDVYAVLERDASFQTAPNVTPGAARNQPAAAALHTATDSAGAWSIPHLAAGARYRVWAVREDVSASRTIRDVVVSAGQSVRHDLTLAPLLERELRVVLADGTLVRREGEILPAASEYPAWVFGPDDDEEVHRLIRAHAGRYRLVYEGPGVLDQEVAFDVPDRADGPIRVVIQPGLTLRGSVTDAAGAGLAEVSIACTPVDAQQTASGHTRHEARTKTARDGSFEVTGLAAVPYLVECYGGDLPIEPLRIEPPFEDLEILAGAPPVPATLRFRLPPGAARGGVRMSYSLRDSLIHAQTRWSQFADVTCDADGAASVEFDGEGALHFEIDVPGWPPLRVPFTAERGKATDLGTLERPPTVPIDLSVVDARGLPVAGVRVLPHDRDDLGGRTDADGLLHLRAVGLGKVRLALSVDGYPSQQSFIVVQQDAGRLDVVLLRGGTLRGRVEDEDGRPVAMDLFAFAPQHLGNGTHQRSIRSDAAGQFSIPALPGSWRVEARRGEETVAIANVLVHDEQTADVTLVVPPAD